LGFIKFVAAPQYYEKLGIDSEMNPHVIWLET